MRSLNEKNHDSETKKILVKGRASFLASQFIEESRITSKQYLTTQKFSGILENFGPQNIQKFPLKQVNLKINL